MAHIKIRIKMNTQGIGVPLPKLLSIIDETQKFLDGFCGDLGIKIDKENWSAEKFTNSNLECDIFNPEVVKGEDCENSNKELDKIMRDDYENEVGKNGISKTTYRKYTNIANKIGFNESVGLGLYKENVLYLVEI